MLAPFGMRVALLTGGMKAAARRTTLAAIRNDEADLVVGTHAILSEGVEFARLGLAVIDEQHRFGVRQRGMLAEKAANPHLLVMSATPIPRTLGLLIYGDLDISILDELPPGRTPVKTRCITGKKRRDLYHFLDQEIGRGRQVYLVCPAIETHRMAAERRQDLLRGHCQGPAAGAPGRPDARQAQAQGESCRDGGLQSRTAGRTGVHHRH